jgi:hypothetical protein
MESEFDKTSQFRFGVAFKMGLIVNGSVKKAVLWTPERPHFISLKPVTLASKT